MFINIELMDNGNEILKKVDKVKELARQLELAIYDLRSSTHEMHLKESGDSEESHDMN